MTAFVEVRPCQAAEISYTDISTYDDLYSLFTDGGNGKLTADIDHDLDSNIAGGVLTVGADKTVNLNLDGHALTINYASMGTTAVKFGEGASLNIYDNENNEGSIIFNKTCNDVSSQLFYLNKNTTLSVYGGNLTNKYESSVVPISHYCVYFNGTDSSNAVFNMYGGTMSGWGEGVSAYGNYGNELHLYGGTITGNYMGLCLDTDVDSENALSCELGGSINITGNNKVGSYDRNKEENEQNLYIDIMPSADKGYDNLISFGTGENAPSDNMRVGISAYVAGSFDAAADYVTTGQVLLDNYSNIYDETSTSQATAAKLLMKYDSEAGKIKIFPLEISQQPAKDNGYQTVATDDEVSYVWGKYEEIVNDEVTVEAYSSGSSADIGMQYYDTSATGSFYTTVYIGDPYGYVLNGTLNSRYPAGTTLEFTSDREIDSSIVEAYFGDRPYRGRKICLQGYKPAE